MTSRRGKLVEEGACELLRMNGYTVAVVPVHFNRHFPPAHLVAELPPGEKRLIRIQKMSRRALTGVNISQRCRRAIRLFRTWLADHPKETGLQCEIWIYTLCNGFRCFAITADSIQEIPKIPDDGCICNTRGAV